MKDDAANFLDKVITRRDAMHDQHRCQQQQQCQHDKVPLVKSSHSEEMVKKGQCPDCGVNLVELD